MGRRPKPLGQEVAAPLVAMTLSVHMLRAVHRYVGSLVNVPFEEEGCSDSSCCAGDLSSAMLAGAVRDWVGLELVELYDCDGPPNSGS
jgi:hypothetical protein